MRDPQQFEAFVRAGLAQHGLEADDLELHIMRIVEEVYGPPRDALLVSDFSDVPPEIALDPSRAPQDR
jgi:hypothetical protein